MSSNHYYAFLDSIKEENLLSVCGRKLLRINYYFSSGDNTMRKLIAGTEKNVTESRENYIINKCKSYI
jgi:hypothetical protein